MIQHLIIVVFIHKKSIARIIIFPSLTNLFNISMHTCSIYWENCCSKVGEYIHMIVIIGKFWISKSIFQQKLSILRINFAFINLQISWLTCRFIVFDLWERKKFEVRLFFFSQECIVIAIIRITPSINPILILSNIVSILLTSISKKATTMSSNIFISLRSGFWKRRIPYSFS